MLKIGEGHFHSGPVIPGNAVHFIGIKLLARLGSLKTAVDKHVAVIHEKIVLPQILSRHAESPPGHFGIAHRGVALAGYVNGGGGSHADGGEYFRRYQLDDALSVIVLELRNAVFPAAHIDAGMLHESRSQIPVKHRAQSRAPCATQQPPTSYLFHTWQCIYS